MVNSTGEIDIFRGIPLFRTNSNHERKSKILIVGNSGVGKTSLRQRYIKGSFRDQLMTIGVEFSSKELNIGGQEIKLEIYDIAGQDSFNLQKRILKNIHGIIIVFDLTRHESFFSIRPWIDRIYEFNPRTKAPLMIVGNKSDLNSKREIPTDDIDKFVKTLEKEREISANYIEFIETSAKTGKNTDLVFNTIARYILDCYY